MHTVYLVDYILYQNVNLFFCPLLPGIQNIVVLFKGSHASPARPYYTSSSKIMMNLQHWWKNAVRGKSPGRRI
jgi:hypothetical protein